jgi:hypothetical protein
VSLARFAKRRDANERDIIDGLEKLGMLVFQSDQPCDLFVFIPWKPVEMCLRALEVKPKKNAKWQPGQRERLAKLRIPVVTDLAEAIAALEAA